MRVITFLDPLALVTADLKAIALVGAVFLIPQVVGYILFWWWSRGQRSGARLVGVLAPPLTLLVPYGLLMAMDRLTDQASSGRYICGYDPISPLIALLAGIHFGVAVLAHGVGWLLEPSIDDLRVTPDSEARRPN